MAIQPSALGITSLHLALAFSLLQTFKCINLVDGEGRSVDLF